jgi:hypothetical protein
MTRLRDEFFLAADARPATADHYMAWLENHIDRADVWWSGVSLSLEPFPAEKFFTVSKSVDVPEFEGRHSLSLISPPGVTLRQYRGTSNIYSFDAAQRSGSETIRVWKGMLDGLINDGYDLSRIVQSGDLRAAARTVILGALKGEAPGSNDFYEELSKGATFENVQEMAARLKTVDAVAHLREFLDIRPETALDAKSLKYVDVEMKEAAQALDVLRFKLDPESREPIPAFGKRAKIQLGPVIKLKEPGR